MPSVAEKPKPKVRSRPIMMGISGWHRILREI
jgi:hypothetical protein